ALGTLGLLVLPGLYAGPGLSFIDAVFTATSAVCVTGLIVVDTATYFTAVGQAWIALLIQLGGLGILTIATAVIVVIGRHPGLSVHESVGQQTLHRSMPSIRRLLWSVVALTLIAECTGALLLWIRWAAELGWSTAVGHAVFHAISAFCNAGFSTFSASLIGFRHDSVTLGIVGVLVVLGGLGFVVCADLWMRYALRRTRRLSLHATLVLATTAILVAGAAVLFYGFEAGNTLADLPPIDRVANAVFMAVTPRTAGFNTVNYDTITDPSLVLTTLLMVVGGSPGSTAGGIKTTTVALLALLFVSYLRGRRDVSVRGRPVPPEVVSLATGIVVAGAIILASAVFLLMLSEVSPETTGRAVLVRAGFEAVSAFGTVGLSMGTTTSLTTAGKLVITFLMFLGRVGPLTLAAAMAIAGRRRRVHYRYAHESVVVG
ncbi:MAG: potassium transporter TrkH, partial [Gemmatimonadales bacterium]|nr:potassium transporter TrkH [Gemmatimonadales bacterium]